MLRRVSASLWAASRELDGEKGGVVLSKYLGGKARLVPKFAPILLAALRVAGGGDADRAALVEPFMGGFNVVPALRKIGWRAAYDRCAAWASRIYEVWLAA